MCTRNTTIVSETAKQFIGQSCPACGHNESKLNFMQFLDPHGQERFDPDIFECSEKRHTFVVTEGGLRLLAADGKRCRERKLFHFESTSH